jgi:hypothetical protein
LHTDPSENKKLPVFFHFAKEYSSLQNDTDQTENIDRHMAENTSRNCFLLSITQAKSKNPFSDIPQNSNLRLLAVHVQLEGVRSFLEQLFS